MSLPTLEEFLVSSKARDWPSNSYVKALGFATFYVRRSRRLLDGEWIDHVLDLANIEAEAPGQGAFTALVDNLLKRGIPLYVECVMFERFALKLERLGFTRVDQPGAPSFFKLPEQRGVS